MQRMGENNASHEDEVESFAEYHVMTDNPFDRNDFHALVPPSEHQEEKRHSSPIGSKPQAPAVELASSARYEPVRARKKPLQILPVNKADLSPFELRVIQHIRDTTDPLGFLEHIVVLTAIYSSMATASTEHHFGENFVKLIQNGIFIPSEVAQMLSWVIATPASAVQFAFSLGTALNFDTRLLRATTHELAHLLTKCSFDEFKLDLPYLLKGALFTVLPSALPTVVMGYETFKTAPDNLRYMIEFGRFKGAVASNGSYYDRYEKDQIIAKNKNPKIQNNTFNNFALTRLLESVRDKLKVLARDRPDAYIEVLSEGLLDSLHLNTSFETKVKTLLKLNKTLDELIDFSQFQAGATASWIAYLSLFLGFITSLVNVKAATKVPELIGWPVVDNPIEFFQEGEWVNPQLLWGFLLCLVCVGYGSSKNNTLINRDASSRLISKLARFAGEGWTAHFASYSRWDLWRLRAICASGVFYAATKGGSAVGYPVLPVPAVSIPEACFMTVVFGGLAYMSLDSFLNNLSNRWNRYLFTGFLTSKDKMQYFLELPEEKQLKLIDLIDIYLNFALGQMIDLVNNYKEEETNRDLSQNLIDELEKLFPKPNQQPAARNEDVADEEAKNDDVNEHKYSDSDNDLDDAHQYEPPLPQAPELLPARQTVDDGEAKQNSPMLQSLHRRHMSRNSATRLDLPPPTLSPALTPQKGAPTFFSDAIYRSSATKNQVSAALTAAHNSRGASPRLVGSHRIEHSRIHDIETGSGSPPALELSPTKH
jgi:hypothetical protein